jgi:hypothetical protein
MKTKRPQRIPGKKLNAGARSLKHLRRLGYTAEVCEQFKARVQGKGQAAVFAGGFRKDLFGFVDILAFDTTSILAVQTTSRQQITAHIRKYRRDNETAEKIRGWLMMKGRRLVVHGWECVAMPKVKGDGTKAVWQLTEREVTVADLGDERRGFDVVVIPEGAPQ